MRSCSTLHSEGCRRPGRVRHSLCSLDRRGTAPKRPVVAPCTRGGAPYEACEGRGRRGHRGGRSVARSCRGGSTSRLWTCPTAGGLGMTAVFAATDSGPSAHRRTGSGELAPISDGKRAPVVPGKNTQNWPMRIGCSRVVCSKQTGRNEPGKSMKQAWSSSEKSRTNEVQRHNLESLGSASRTWPLPRRASTRTPGDGQVRNSGSWQRRSPRRLDSHIRDCCTLSCRLGAHDQALVYAQKAEDSFRQLAETNPNAYRPDWALALDGFANRLGAVGRHDQAVSCAQKAEETYRQLAEADPDVYQFDWARSVGNLAKRLDNVGRNMTKRFPTHVTPRCSTANWPRCVRRHTDPVGRGRSAI